MKLSDIKGVDAIDTVADLMEPIAKIATNEKIKELGNKFAQDMKGANEKEKIALKIRYARDILKACPQEIIEVFAILDRTPVEEYEFSLASLPQKIVELINDPYIMELFGLQSQEQTSSGSAMENTEVEKN